MRVEIIRTLVLLSYNRMSLSYLYFSQRLENNRTEEK